MFGGMDIELQSRSELDELHAVVIPAAERRAHWFAVLARSQAAHPADQRAPSRWRRLTARFGRSRNRRGAQRPTELAT